MAEEEKNPMAKAAGGVLGVAAGGTLAGALAAKRLKKKQNYDPRFNVEEADKTRAGMLQGLVKDAQSPIDEAMVGQQAEQVYQASMGPGQQANIEAMRAGMAGGLQPGQQLDMFGKATEKAQEEKAKTLREGYQQAGEQKMRQADKAYTAMEKETARLKEERSNLLFDKIPRIVGAGGVALNKLAESGFLDDLIGVGGAIAGSAGGIMGGPAGMWAGAAGGFQAGKALGETAQDAITAAGGVGDAILGGGDDEPEELPEETADEAEPESERAERTAKEARQAELRAVMEGSPEEVAERLAERREARESVGEGGFEDDEEPVGELPEDVTGQEAARQEMLERQEGRVVEPSGDFDQDDDELDVAPGPTLDQREARRQALLESQRERFGQDTEGGFEQDTEDLEFDQPDDDFTLGRADLGDISVESETEHAATLANAATLPTLPSGIMEVGDFNESAQAVLGSSSPADVNAMYIAAGIRPPNNEMPSPEAIARAKAAADQQGSDFNLMVGAVREELSESQGRTRRFDELRNRMTQ